MAIQGSYRINFTDPKNGSFVIEPYTVNGNVTPTSDVLHPKATRANTSLQLPGQYVPNYGELVHEDLVHLLENFSGDTAPEAPIEGQCWYDTGDSFSIVDLATSGCTIAGNHSAQFSSFISGATPLTAWYGPVSVTDNSYLSISFKATTVMVTSENNTVITITALDDSALTLPNTAVGGFITPSNASRLGRLKIATKVNNTITWSDVVNVNCSTIAPTPEYIKTGDLWYDLNVSQLKIRINGVWVSVTGGYLPLSGGTMTGQLNMGNKPIIFSGTVSTANTLTNKLYVDTAIATAIEPLQTGTEQEIEDLKDRVDVIETVLPDKVSKAGDNIRGALTFGPDGTTTTLTRGVDMKDNAIINPSITWNAADYLIAASEASNVVDKNYTAMALKQHMLDVAHGGKVFIVEQPDGSGRITDPIFFTNLSDTLTFRVNSTSYGLGVTADALVMYTGNFIGSKIVFKQTGASTSLFEMSTDAARSYKSIYLFDGQPQPSFNAGVTAENDETKVATKGYVVDSFNTIITAIPIATGATFAYTVEGGPYNLSLKYANQPDIVVDLNHTHKSERIIHNYEQLTAWKSGATDLVGNALGNPAQTQVSNMLSALNRYKAPTSGAKFEDFPVVSLESKVISINDANSSFDLTAFLPANLPVGTEIVMTWTDGTLITKNYIITAMNTVPDGGGGPDKYFYVTSPALPTAHNLVTKPMTCAVPVLAERTQLNSLINVSSLKYAPLYDSTLVGNVPRAYYSKLSDIVSVKDFGAIGDGTYHPLSQRFGTLVAAQQYYMGVPITSLTQSIDWAACQAAINTGRRCLAPAGVYVLTNALTFANGQSLIGDGLDVWDQLTPSSAKSNSKGTHFIMYGTGAKTYTSYGVTDNAVSGGAFANPEPLALDTTYSLTSFHNSNATTSAASTLRQFSCGIYIAPTSRNVTLRGFRIHPWYNGLAGYNDTVGYGLGDDWDVGIFNDNACDVVIEDVQSVGYWRIAANLQISSTRPGVQGASYHCRYNRVNFQGRVGFMLRGGDSYRMLQRTATTVDIPWQASHPFPLSGGFSSNAGIFLYTSTSKVTDGTYGEVLRFSGITGDTSGVTQVRISSGWGMGGTTVQNFMITGLDHSSGKRASSAEIGMGISTGLEISGAFRQPFFSQGYVQTMEDVVAHIHNVDDLRFVETQFESNGKRGRMIASPQDIVNTRVPYANGSSSITMVAVHKAGADEFPLVDRATTESVFTGAGFWEPRRIHDQDNQFPDSDQLDISGLLTQNIRLNLAAGKQLQVRNSAAANLVTVSETSGLLQLVTGQLSLPTGSAGFINAGTGQSMNLRQGTTIRLQIGAVGGHWLPGADNAQNVGSGSLRVAVVYAGTGTINTSDERVKSDIQSINELAMDAWKNVEYMQYKFTDAITTKGEADARVHFGVVAQRVKEEFEAVGLDPFEFGLLCYDEWDAEEAILDTDGSTIQEYRPAGNRYGIRYEEALVLEAALMRRTTKQLEDKIALLMQNS